MDIIEEENIYNYINPEDDLTRDEGFLFMSNGDKDPCKKEKFEYVKYHDHTSFYMEKE